jgi:purine-binding chemotaxis protein CheW
MSLSQTKAPALFDRKSPDRRQSNEGPPDGNERRSQTSDRRMENNLEFVTFFIGENLVGIPVNLVQEIVPAQKIAKIPLSRAEIRGLINLRGQIVTVIDLRKKIGISASDSQNPMNVIINYGGDLLSLEVDSVGDVLPVAKSMLLTSPPTLNGFWKETCENVVQLERGLLIIINIQKVFGF